MADGGAEPPPFPRPPEGAVLWSVIVDGGGRASLQRGAPPEVRGAVAWGSFDDAINETGWAVLDVHSSAAHAGAEQGYAAGFLEGALTHARITQHLANMWGIDFHDAPARAAPRAIHAFLGQNLAWMEQEVRAHPSDPYWQTLGSLLSQLRGLTDGYNAARGAQERSIPQKEMFIMSLIDADMDDLMTAIVTHGDFVNERFRHHGGRGYRSHCSALVQVAPGNADIWMGHNTWDVYRSMIKMVKYLDMPLPGAAARRMVFTSNPGSLYSADDFYIIDTGLTVMETSNTNYNRALWGMVRPQTVLTWARSMLANRLATTAPSWTELHARHHSGTCNNQWIVVDYKRFAPGRPLLSDTLWILELLPGLARSADVTGVLRQQGSWPSYNVPYFPDIWAAGGYGAMQARHPRHADFYSHTRCVRARMFERARFEGTPSSLSSFMGLLRYNNLSDPLEDSACHAISSRCDLQPQSHIDYDCYGAVDAKATRWSPQGAADLNFFLVAGPTHGEGTDGLRPFSWGEQNASVDGCRPDQHVGHPETFNFGWHALPTAWYAHQAHNDFAAAADRGESGGTVGPASLLRAGLGVSFLLLGLMARIWHRGLAGRRSAADYVLIDER